MNVDTKASIISCDRFVLRSLQASDRGLIRMYTSDECLARNTESIPHPLPPGATKAFIERGLAENSQHDIWVIDGFDHGLAEVLGVIALKRLDDWQSEIGYWVAPAFWNTGFASEALGAIVEANPQGAETLFGQVFQDNPASGKVLTHCGFQYLGDAEVFCVARDAAVPTWTYLRKCG